MYSVLIVDDDVAAAARVRSMLECCPHAAELSIFAVDFAAAVEADALDEAITDAESDIVFMDIELGAGCESGIELVRRLFPDGSRTQVIYVTGHIEYCQDVYTTPHVSFLVKPVEQGRLDAAVARAASQLDARLDSMLTLRTSVHVRRIPFDRIEFIESMNRKAFIHTRDRVLEEYMSLAEVESLLPRQFVRCHKSFVVNMGSITELRPDGLTLSSGAWVPVSRTRRQDVQTAFAAYLTALPSAL